MNSLHGGAPQWGAQVASVFYMFSSAMEIFHAFTKNKIGFNFSNRHRVSPLVTNKCRFFVFTPKRSDLLKPLQNVQIVIQQQLELLPEDRRELLLTVRLFLFSCDENETKRYVSAYLKNIREQGDLFRRRPLHSDRLARPLYSARLRCIASRRLEQHVQYFSRLCSDFVRE